MGDDTCSLLTKSCNCTLRPTVALHEVLRLHGTVYAFPTDADDYTAAASKVQVVTDIHACAAVPNFIEYSCTCLI